MTIYIVEKQDDNGNVFPVQFFSTEKEALKIAQQYNQEYKQYFFVRITKYETE